MTIMWTTGNVALVALISLLFGMILGGVMIIGTIKLTRWVKGWRIIRWLCALRSPKTSI